MAIFRRAAPIGAAEVAEGGGPVAVTADSTTAAGGTAVYPQPPYLVSAFVLIVIGTVVGTIGYDHWATSVSFTPPAGVGIFALFYIMAQVVERLQEPFAPFVRGAKTADTGETGERGTLNQLQAKANLERKLADSAASDLDVANAKRTLDQVRANMNVLLFGGAALIAMIGMGYMKALLLLTVGMHGLVPWFDVLVTGLAIGGGTKALHDLLSNVKEAKEQKQDPTTEG